MNGLYGDSSARWLSDEVVFSIWSGKGWIERALCECGCDSRSTKKHTRNQKEFVGICFGRRE